MLTNIISTTVFKNQSKDGLMKKTTDEFELTNCPDPNCFICVKQMRGYPSSLELHPFHYQQAAKGMAVILDWIDSAGDLS
jgi:hypothetical protein